MDLSQEIEEFISHLREANKNWQQKMILAGYDEEEVHYWWHYIDEIYDEIRRSLLPIAATYAENDPQKVPRHLWLHVVPSIRDIAASEMIDYMNYLHEALYKYIPDIYKGSIDISDDE